MKDRMTRLAYRRERVRRRLERVAHGRPRLSVHRSLRHLYAQVIDDSQGATLAHASSLSPELRGKLSPGAGDNLAAARAVGELIARKAREKGIRKVAFDRAGLLYHGRVKALADAARAVGLEF